MLSLLCGFVRRSVAGCVFFTVVGVACGLQAADDPQLVAVLDRIMEANGGARAVDGARSLRVAGTIESGDMTYDFTLLKKRPNMMRITFFYKGRIVDSGYDGKVAWREMRMGDDQRQLEYLGAEDSDAFLSDLDFDGPLIGEPLPGVERSYIGSERIDRVDYHVVEVRRGSHVTRHYIDSRNYREFKTVATRVVDGQPVEIVSLFSQYQRLGTIWMAYHIERKTGSNPSEVIRITKAELNPGLLDRAFQPPTGHEP
jgi:hypothetical protein